MDDRRVVLLKKKKFSKRVGPVVYLMSRDQRVSDNHALVYAQQQALSRKVPLLVVFNLLAKTNNRAREHFEFMIDGLKEVELVLSRLQIPFLLFIDDAICGTLGDKLVQLSPSILVCDAHSLKGPRKLQRRLAEQLDCPVHVVDTHNIIPMWHASSKSEVAAYTFRPKVHRQIEEWLQEPEQAVKHSYTWPNRYLTITELTEHIANQMIRVPKNSVKHSFVSGETAALRKLQEFIEYKLHVYAYDRNNPTKDAQSGLSVYLHFGQISAMRVALEIQKTLRRNNLDIGLLTSSKMPQISDFSEPTLRQKAGADALLEELIVRKELADNFCYYTDGYENLSAAPMWAVKSLEKHADDKREYSYTKDDLESAMTHDDAWNAAQKQLRKCGKIHGYMRMYWAKKVLEWTSSPAEALGILQYLNDFYSIDGGDPNGYVGILWSVAGLHDRPWFERPIFGAVRYMNQVGLKRKFKIQEYIDKPNSRVKDLSVVR